MATYDAALVRGGPGLLLRDILSGEDPQVLAAAGVIASTAPDILVLTSFDYDLDGVALRAFAAQLAELGHDMPHHFARRPNTGMQTGHDLDGDGRAGDPRDAQGFGLFSGQAGMAVLSRYPFDLERVHDLSALLWRDAPDAVLPEQNGEPFYPEDALAALRLSHTAHWSLPITTDDGPPLTMLAFSATPPVFDGPEDRNGLRNAQETLLWRSYLDGHFGAAPHEAFVIAGKANLDPIDGNGLHEAARWLTDDPRLQDPRPASRGGVHFADADHFGDPSLDTADWRDGAPGNLRVDYVIPSADWQVLDAGVFWPAPGDPGFDLLGPDGQAAGAHRLVWVDLVRDGPRQAGIDIGGNEVGQ